MATARYTLTDAEQRAAEHPLTFNIPTKQERENLLPGDFAKMIFDERERMWVEVSAQTEDGGYHGCLDNNPIVVTYLRRGDVVTFYPKHVIEVITRN